MLGIDPSAAAERGRRVQVLSGKIEIAGKIAENLWKVRAGTGEYTVFSTLKLKPGDIITGRITEKNSILLLTMIKKQDRPPAGPVFFAPGDNTADRLVSFAARAMGERPDDLLRKLLAELFLKKEIKDEHEAALVCEAYKKGFRSQNSLASLLSAVCEGQQRHGGKHGGGRGKEREKEAEGLKGVLPEAVNEAENLENSLFLFNHTGNGRDRWVIIPYSAGEDEGSIKGSLRLKISGNRTRKIVLHADKGAFTFFFDLSLEDEKEKTLKVYSSGEGKKVIGGKNFMMLKKKLQNLGVKTDDNIHDLASFSGFTEVDALRSIDFKA